jgi:hypothetical protein
MHEKVLKEEECYSRLICYTERYILLEEMKGNEWRRREERPRIFKRAREASSIAWVMRTSGNGK